MESLDISTLQIGHTLARDIYDIQGRMLLPKGSVLNDTTVASIMRVHEGKIYIATEDAAVDSIFIIPSRPDTPDEIRFKQAFARTVGCVHKMMDDVVNGHIVKRSEVHDAITIIYPEVIQSHNILRCLQGLKQQDDYTFAHSVSVCVLSVKLGQLMGIPASKLQHLGIAGLLHDMGKAKVPLDILNKPARLTDEEFDEIKKHPVYGFRIVRDIELNDRAIELAVLQHHERLDGTGYPLRLGADKLHLFSSIVAVADVFDAITSERKYRPRFELLAAMEEIARKPSGYLDPIVSQKLIQYVMSMVPGEDVLLNTGEIASIVMVFDNEPLRPLVRVDERFIDLREHRQIHIENRL